ncbi:hypothetical protein [Phenylobacterium sp.]|uniref:hypothetical protein n=1 Tax=Phenylobacterium sp. TaxID=1871053 RepID=UPI00271FD5B1|nr:hypothetical protein [Phenylobacterium sp.]MDO8379761.1 hypothetical protein [Phenylobacterium sp.]
MTQHMKDLAEEIVRLQGDLDREIEARRKALGWKLKEQIGQFEHGITLEHRRLRLGLTKFFGRTSLAVVLTAPVIYSLIIPLVIVDAWVSAYQAICFRAYRIPQVKRGDYFAFDRGRLSYLNVIEGVNCAFCAYANGVVAYVREISSRTEQYWCPIKHALRISDPHRRYYEFLDYGDAEGYRARLNEFRDRLRAEPAGAEPRIPV